MKFTGSKCKIKGNGLKLHKGRSNRMLRKISTWKGWPSFRTGYPGKRWNHHLSRYYSEVAQMWCLGTWCPWKREVNGWT